MSFLNLTEEQRVEIFTRLFETVKRDSEAQVTVGKAKIMAYRSPDGKVVLFRYGGENKVYAVTGPGAEFGYSIGDNIPDWAVVDEYANPFEGL
jgi:hypothetical protein